MPFGLTQLLFPTTSEGRFVNVLILLIFVWGLCRTWLLGAAIRRERGVLKHVQKDLARFQDGVEDDKVQETVATLDALRHRTNLVTLDAGPQPVSLIGRRSRALWRLRNAGRGSLEALGVVEEARQGLRLDMPRYLTSILVLVGLARTIASLRGIISQLNGALADAASDPAALL